MSTRESPAMGGCQCGAVRYELRGAPLVLLVCHCRECRKQSASAFGISVIVNAGDVSLVSGQTRCWARPADSGGAVECHFCPTCGSRLWHAGNRIPGRLSLKGGSLDDPPDLSTAVHIWVSRKLPGVILPPGARCYPEEPPR
jgi:hypothetical protein